VIVREDALTLLGGLEERTRAMETRAHPYYRLPSATTDLPYTPGSVNADWRGLGGNGTSGAYWARRANLYVVRVVAEPRVVGPPTLITTLDAAPPSALSVAAYTGGVTYTLSLGTDGHLTYSGGTLPQFQRIAGVFTWPA
jgi:hypothetical protein